MKFYPQECRFTIPLGKRLGYDANTFSSVSIIWMDASEDDAIYLESVLRQMLLIAFSLTNISFNTVIVTYSFLISIRLFFSCCWAISFSLIF